MHRICAYLPNCSIFFTLAIALPSIAVISNRKQIRYQVVLLPPTTLTMVAPCAITYDKC